MLVVATGVISSWLITFNTGIISAVISIGGNVLQVTRDIVSPVPGCLHPPPPPPPPERNCKPGASNQQRLPLTYVTAKTQHTGGFTPCTDGLHDGPGTDTTPPSLHVLEFTEKPMQGYMYKKVTIHV